MTAKTQLRILVAVLLIIGLGATAYKHLVLGFPLTPGESSRIWTVQAQMTFRAQGDPVKAQLNLPDMTRHLYVVPEGIAPRGYGYHVEQVGSQRMAVWEARAPTGDQRLFFRARVYKGGGIATQLPPPSDPPAKPIFAEPEAAAADALLADAYAHSADATGLALRLARSLWGDAAKPVRETLLGQKSTNASRTKLLLKLLHASDVPAHELTGFYLTDNSRSVTMEHLIELWDGTEWQVVVPKEGIKGMPEDFLPWQSNGEFLMQVDGGTDSKVSFATIVDKISSRQLAVQMGQQTGAGLIDFSVFALPVDVQNTFATLLLIPIGALVVVVMRNLVGLQTSGTFMPILIAMVFVQTDLLVGLALFIVVVGAGLVIRGYLTSLNLLLVPRIAAVLIVVTTLYLLLAVVGFKLGIEAALSVTFFPMIIIAWTIERMSVLAEEEGMWDVFVQSFGSLLTATIAYLLMINQQVSFLTFAFPELLLVVLAIILVIGQYTGFRLSELRRFEPLASEKE
ncbi:UUP1 family membrane protein [Shimia haliotis]|uniref:Inactive transglutaminase fused to 7 transmembrane helices n=1 Tax=Shimia haliotis TaxID=1280847 RepID=A0A1I4A602_9RHOB|nr:UUP1 family membrane protein [Shimia haliotis]SFK51361.1 Inactive transglutaminase fused to 7 transmembrane helices [Shimia haliotis]